MFHPYPHHLFVRPVVVVHFYVDFDFDDDRDCNQSNWAGGGVQCVRVLLFPLWNTDSIRYPVFVVVVVVDGGW